MAKFLGTLAALGEIENIIRNARNRLNLISPYLDIPEPLLQSLKDAARRRVKITFVYGDKKELQPGARNQLEQLDNPSLLDDLSLRFLENLHAKCFYNEESMVITSLNLLDSSRDNREMGVLITIQDDKDCFRNAVSEAELIVNSSEEIDLAVIKSDDYSHRTTQEGYCIRCRASIGYDVDRPYCRDCFLIWLERGNQNYEESYCHTCGQPEPTSKARPRCGSCYWRQV